jgi:hypothetical protein
VYIPPEVMEEELPAPLTQDHETLDDTDPVVVTVAESCVTLPPVKVRSLTATLETPQDWERTALDVSLHPDGNCVAIEPGWLPELHAPQLYV